MRERREVQLVASEVEQLTEHPAQPALATCLRSQLGYHVLRAHRHQPTAEQRAQRLRCVGIDDLGHDVTWIRTLRDIVVPADKQVRFAGNVGDCPVVDIDSGHMCMVSRPRELAELLARVA